MTTETENHIDPLTWGVDQYLSQGDVWLTSRRERGFALVSDMNVGWRAQSSQWLERHAMPLISLVETERTVRLMDGDVNVSLSDILDLVSENPKTWIRGTALYRALTVDAPNER